MLVFRSRISDPLYVVARLLLQDEVLKAFRAEAPLELVNDSPYLRPGLMGTGNTEGLARMPILEMSWTGSRRRISEDLVH
jgi:hypothetical protein